MRSIRKIERLGVEKFTRALNSLRDNFNRIASCFGSVTSVAARESVFNILCNQSQDLFIEN